MFPVHTSPKAEHAVQSLSEACGGRVRLGEECHGPVMYQGQDGESPVVHRGAWPRGQAAA